MNPKELYGNKGTQFFLHEEVLRPNKFNYIETIGGYSQEQMILVYQNKEGQKIRMVRIIKGEPARWLPQTTSNNELLVKTRTAQQPDTYILASATEFWCAYKNTIVQNCSECQKKNCIQDLDPYWNQDQIIEETMSQFNQE